MMRFVVLCGVLLCVIPSLCVDSFEYDERRPFYTVGKAITENKPNPPKEGSYTVKPDLPEGLSLDPRNGYISGTPKVEVYNRYIVTFNAGKGDEAVCTLEIVCLAVPSVNCGVSKLTAVSLINTFITCTATGDPSDNEWKMTPKEVKGITQDGPYLWFHNFNPQTNMKITIEVENAAGIGKFEIEIVKVENPELGYGIYVSFNDLETTKCGDYYDGIANYDFYEGPMDDLYDLTDFQQWQGKMGIYVWGQITTFNGTMDGFIDIANKGEYTFYMQTGNEMNARVFIDDKEVLSDWGKCNQWNETPLTAKVQLETGLHRVVVEFMGGEGLDFRFVLDYSTPGSVERMTIPFRYYNSYFDPVTFLTADSLEVSWLYDAFSLTPLHVSRGVPTSCWITNNAQLPEGSEVTVEGIKGHPQSVMDQTEYKVKCKNRDSETNEITIKLRVTKNTIEGVRSYYYKPYNFDTSLFTKYGPSVDGNDPLYIQRQDAPFISESQDVPHPEGLSEEFLDDYGVYWEGYLRPWASDLGPHNFRITADGGYWIYFDNKEMLAKPGRNKVEDPAYFDFELTDDSFFVQIYYVSHNGHAFFDFAWKKSTETEDSYSSFLPFSYVPVNDYFVMTQSTATYLKGQEVENYVLPVEYFDCKEITVDPPLPDGLEAHCTMFEQPAVIEGTPTTDRLIELTEHTVTITSRKDKSVSTTIYIAVKPVQSPDGFYILDVQTGKKYTDSVSLVVGEFYDLQFHVETGYVIAFGAENIPVGFSFNWESSTLSGSPREKLDTKVKVIAIVRPSDGDSKEFSFTIKADGGCESGNRHVFHFSNDFAENGVYLMLTVTASNGTSVINVYERETVSLPRTYSMCLPVDTYTIRTGGMFDYYFTVYNNGVRVYRYYADFPSTSSHTFTLNTDPVLPKFKYITNNATYYQWNQVLLVPRAETFIDYFTITPSKLPRGFVFNNMTGRLYGTATRVTNATNYKITAYNDKGQASFDILIQVLPDTQEEDCENAGKFLVGLTLYVGTYYERPGYQLINSKDEVVFDRIQGTYFADSVYRIKMCITKGWYTLRLVDYSGYGWGNSNITISAGNSIIGRYTILYNENEVNVTTDFTYIIDTHTQWQYSQQYVPNWELKNESVSWPSSTINTLPKPPSTPTYYLRYPLLFPNYNKYSGYFIRIKHRSGVIVRVNGRQIFRDNLPPGDIGPNTPGDTAYERAREENFILPIDDLNDTAIITYEIHKSPNDDNFPNEDKFFIFPLDGDNDEDCILVAFYGGRVTDSSSKSFGKDGKNLVDAAFDLSEGSDWRDYYGTVDGYSYADYSFGENSHYAFNQLTIIAGTGLDNHYPMKVSLNGITDTGKVELGTLDPVEYFTMKKNAPGRATHNVNPYTLYKSVRIDIPLSNQYDYNDRGMSVKEIGYHLCRIKKCPANPALNLPEGISNTFITRNCSKESDPGEKLFYCSNFALWMEVKSTCGDKPEFITTTTTVTLEAGHAYEYEAIFEVTGKPDSYNFSCPSCPSGEFIQGLTFDKAIGLISGTPYIGATHVITFTAMNAYGTATITMTIIITPTNKMIIYKYNPSVQLTLNADIPENKTQLFWVQSGTTVTYSVDELPIGITLDSSTGFISGKPNVPGDHLSLFTIKNAAGERETRYVRIYVETTSEPVITHSVDKIDLIYMTNYDDQYPIVCSASSTLTYSVDKNLPATLTYDPATGAMKGKVTAPVQSAVNYKFSCSADGKSVSKDIPISIVQADDVPIIISQNETVTLTAGQELFNEQFFVVSGNNLVYSITPTLPQVITMDAKTGLFNGYGKGENNNTYRINVSNGKASVELRMLINVTKSDKPVIPDSTVKKDIEVATGALVSVQLFDSVGEGLSVSVNPPLPEGFSISSTGYLQGLSVVDVAKQDYVITVTDKYGKSASVTIKLEFKAKKCPANGGFPETLVGDQAVIKCGGGKSGYMIRKCIYADGNAIWQSPIDDCSASIVGPLIGIIIACIIGGGVIFLGGYCIYVRVGGGKKHVRKTAEQMVDASKDAGVRI